MLEARLLPYLRAQYACPDIVVADALVRRHRPKPKPKPEPNPYPYPNPDQVRRYSPEEPKPKPKPDPHPNPDQVRRYSPEERPSLSTHYDVAACATAIAPWP